MRVAPVYFARPGRYGLLALTMDSPVALAPFPIRHLDAVRRRTIVRRLSGAVVGTALLLAGCQAPTVQAPPPPVQPEPPPLPQVEFPAQPMPAPADLSVTQIEIDGPVKVGVLLPLSGRYAQVGEAMLNAAQLALFDVAGDRFALVVRDTAATPDGAAQAARDALADGARLILGPLFATSVAAVAPEARAAGVNVIAFSNDRSIAGDGVYVMGLAPEPQIDRLVGYASTQGLRRFAVMAPGTPYGQAVVAAIQEAVVRHNVELSRVVSYPPDATDLTVEVRNLGDYDARHQALLAQRQVLAARGDEAAKLALRRLNNLDTLGKPDFDAVILPEGGKRLQTIAPSLAYYDIDPAEIRFLGTSLWEDSSLGTEPTLVGGWFTAPQPELWLSFAERYQRTYGAPPPRVASLAYDAAALAAVLARRAVEANQPADFSAAALTQPSGFSGIDGVFRYLPDGTVERHLAVLRLIRDGFEVVDPAQRSFRAAGS